MAERDLSWVTLFDGEAASFGDATMNPERWPSIHSTMHGLIDSGGFTPYFRATLTQTILGKVAQAVEWVNSAGQPIILVAGRSGATGGVARINPDGTIVSDFSLLAPFGRPAMALHSDGASQPLLFVCWQGQTIRYRTQAGVWAQVSGTPSQAAGLYSENGNLWAVLSNGYQLRKWPAGVSPVSGVAGAAIDVGTSAFSINGIGLLGRSTLVCVKPDGIYLYDDIKNKFENIWPGLAQMVHPDTGVGVYTWGNEVYVPLGWGGLVRVLPGPQLQDVSPLKRARARADTPGRQRITAMVADGRYLYAALEPFTQRIGQGGVPSLYVQTLDSLGVFRNRTSEATDEDPSTGFSDFTQGTNNELYVGVTDRANLRAFWLQISGATSGAPLSLTYWNGSTWTVISFADYTNSLMQTGAIVPNAPVPSDWAQTNVNGVTAYWLKLVVGIFSNVFIEEVRAIPEGAPLPGVEVTGSDDDLVGVRLHLIRAQPIGGELLWKDIASIEGNDAGALVLSQVKASQQARSLYVLGTQGAHRMAIGQSGNPAEEAYPNCVNAFSSLLRLPAVDFIEEGERAPSVIKQIAAVKLFGEDVEVGQDRIQVFVSYDHRPPAKLGEAFRLPQHLEVQSPAAHGMGFTYAVTVALRDANQGIRPPKLTRVMVGLRAVPGDQT